MKRALLLVTFFLLMAGVAHAQDDTPSITATVTAESTPIRWMPEVIFQEFSDIDSRLGELHAGDELVIHRWESVGFRENRIWVYATHNNLTGWIRSDAITIHSDNWQRTLPEFSTWTALGAFVAENAPNGLQAWVSGGGGGYDRLNVRDEPYVGGGKIGEIFTGSTVTILGRAMTNDVPLRYVYVRDNHTGVEGWVVSNGIYAFGLYREHFNEGIPVIYEVHPLADTAELPQFHAGAFNLRDAPSLDARIRRWVSNLDRFAANGRSADGEWVKATDISSGEVGWVAFSILESFNLEVEDLPVVE